MQMRALGQLIGDGAHRADFLSCCDSIALLDKEGVAKAAVAGNEAVRVLDLDDVAEQIILSDLTDVPCTNR